MHAFKPSKPAPFRALGHSNTRCLLAASLAALVSGLVPGAASVAQAEVVWRGDFETQDLSQWDLELRPEGLSIVDDPVADGSYALRAELSSETVWDNGIFRTELQHKPEASRASEGAELFFGWSVYLPEPLPTGEDQDYQLGYFETAGTYNQVFSLHAIGEGLILSLNHDAQVNEWIEQGTIDTGKWHRIVYHVKWSSDPNQGFVSLWLDGVKLVDQAHARTFIDNQPAFIQVGLLKNPPAPPQPVVLYVDAAMEGDSYEDVSLGIPESDGLVPPDDTAPDDTAPDDTASSDSTSADQDSPDSGLLEDDTTADDTAPDPSEPAPSPSVNPDPSPPATVTPPGSSTAPVATVTPPSVNPLPQPGSSAPSVPSADPNATGPATNTPPAMTGMPGAMPTSMPTATPPGTGMTSTVDSSSDGGGCAVSAATKPSNSLVSLLALGLAALMSAARRRSARRR